MILEDDAGTRFELRLDLDDPISSESEWGEGVWLDVHTSVSLGDVSWSASNHCLMVTDAATLAGWLKRVAQGKRQADVIDFMEPNLACTRLSGDSGMTTLRVTLSHQLAPAEVVTALGSARDEITFDLPISSEQLVRASESLIGDLDRLGAGRITRTIMAAADQGGERPFVVNWVFLPRAASKEEALAAVVEHATWTELHMEMQIGEPVETSPGTWLVEALCDVPVAPDEYGEALLWFLSHAQAPGGVPQIVPPYLGSSGEFWCSLWFAPSNRWPKSQLPRVKFWCMLSNFDAGDRLEEVRQLAPTWPFPME